MTENLPAVRDPKTVARSGANFGDYAGMLDLAAQLVTTGFLPPAIKTPAQCLAVILTGQELGLGPMQSLRSIYIVQGKPALSADLQLALFKRGGGRAEFCELTDEKAVLWLQHANGDEHTETFTMRDAAAAGVTGNPTWKKFPKAMLRSRAITAGLKSVGFEPTSGVYDPEELGVPADEGGLPPLVDNGLRDDIPVGGPGIERAERILASTDVARGADAASSNRKEATSEMHLRDTGRNAVSDPRASVAPSAPAPSPKGGIDPNKRVKVTRGDFEKFVKAAGGQIAPVIEIANRVLKADVGLDPATWPKYTALEYHEILSACETLMEPPEVTATDLLAKVSEALADPATVMAVKVRIHAESQKLATDYDGAKVEANTVIDVCRAWLRELQPGLELIG